MSDSLLRRVRSPSNDRNILVLTIHTFLRGMSQTMRNAIWQPFVLSLGASMPVLGLLEGLGGFRGLINGVVQPLGGWLSDRQGRKKLLVLGGLLSMTSYTLYALAGLLRNWYLLLPGVVFLGLTSMGLPARDSMVAESSLSSKRSRSYSLIGFGYAASGVFAAAMAGLMADRWGYHTVFLSGLGMETVCVALIVRFAVETVGPEDRKAISWGGLAATFRSILVPPRSLRSFYVAMTMDSFAWGIGAGIYYGMLRQTYGFTPTQFGIMSSVFSLSWAVSQLPVGRLIERHGRIRFMAISELLGAAMMMGWLLSSRFESFAVLQVVNGLVVATWLPAILGWMSDHVSDEQRAQQMGKLSAFRAVFSFAGPYIGGLIFDRWGFAGPMTVNIVGAVLVALVLWRFVPEAISKAGQSAE